MNSPRITEDSVITSRIYRIRGQRSRWRYPDQRLTAEHCEVLRDVNISERGVTDSRYGTLAYNATQLAGGEAVVGLWEGVFVAGVTKRVIVTPTAVYTDTGSARVTITGSALTGGNDDRVRFVFLKDQLVLNNSIDAPRVWNGNDTTPTNTSALATVPFTKADEMVVHQNLLMALGTTEGGTKYPTRIRWCNINRQTYVVDINTWGATDRYEIYDGGPAIVGAVDAWGTLMTFKADGLYPGRIVYGPAGDYDFQLDKPQRGFSPLARHSFLSRPEFVFGVAKEGIFVLRPDMSFEIVNTDDSTEWFGLNQGRLQYAQSYVRQKAHQVRTLVSSASNTTGHDRELVWDWETGDLWLDRPTKKKTFGATVTISNEELDWFGTLDGYLFQGNKSTYANDAGTGFGFQIKMSPNDLGAPGISKHFLNIKTLHRARSGEQSVALRVHLDEGREGTVLATLTLGTTYTWNSNVAWNSGKKWPGSSARVTGTYVNRVAETIAPEWTGSDPSSIEGYQVEYVPLEA